MRLFKKRMEPQGALTHIVRVATQASLDNTDEARQAAADHIVADLSTLDRYSLIRVAALAAMCEGDAQAAQVRHAALEMMNQVMAEAAAEEAQEAAQATEPTEVGPEDSEPENAPEAAAERSEDDAPAQGWAEDRR